MKLIFASAVLAAISYAVAVDGDNEEMPLEKLYKVSPKYLRRNGKRFDRDIEAHRVDYDQLTREECREGAMAYDKYCHGVTKRFRNVDWRNVRDSDGEDHECAYSDEPS